MVGTAVYQVGLASPSHAKKRSALKPGVQNTLPPAASDASTAAIRPWMWKSGMMLRQRSSGVERERRADMGGRGGEVGVRQRHQLRPRGRAGGVEQQRDVVPPPQGPGRAAAPIAAPSMVKLPAGPSSSGTSAQHGDAEPVGDRDRRPSLVASRR